MNGGAGTPTGGITSDNIHLSEPIPAYAGEPFAAACNPQAQSDAKVAQFLQAAHAANTRRAYQSDLEQFAAWGGHVPCSDQDVARYLADHAGVLAIATLARRLVAIRTAHVTCGHPDPTKAELVRLTFRGVRRTYGGPQPQAAPITIADLETICERLGDRPKDIRVRAILLVGFAGAFRRSELCGLSVRDLNFRSDRLTITMRRSKTD